ncbi:MAG: cation:proton antiporter [Pseudomonadota bacterium]
MHFDALLTIAVIIIAASAITTTIFSRAGFGSILGLLMTGIVVGPWGLNITEESENLRHTAELGVVFLLFIIGLEMQPRRLWSLRNAVFGLGTTQVVVTGLALFGPLLLIGFSWQAALIVGLGLALSSTAFVMQMLEENRELATQHGQHAFAVLLLQDLAIVPLLALVPLLSPLNRGAEFDVVSMVALPILIIATVIILGRWIIPWALEMVARHRNMEAFALLGILSVLLAAWLMETAGLSMALGGFLMGLMLSTSRFHHQIEADVAPFKGILLSLFFVIIGMSIDLGLLYRTWPFVLGALICLIIIKSAIVLAAGMLFGLRLPQAIRLAAVLAQGGEFGFVLLGAAMLGGLIARDTYVLAVLVIALSMMMTPLMTKLGAYLAKRIEDRGPEPSQLETAAASLNRHVIIAGYGRVGETIVQLLETAAIPYVALERDPDKVAKGRLHDHSVFFGNAANPRVLANSGMDRAAALVVTLDEQDGVRRVVSSARNFYPDVTLLARARDLEARDAMLQTGVSEAVPETVELSLALGEAVLSRVGVSDDDARDAVRLLRTNNFEAIRAEQDDTTDDTAKKKPADQTAA